VGAIGQRRGERVGAAVEDRAHLGEHQLQRVVVVDEVVAEQPQQPLVAQRVVDGVRGEQRRAREVQPHVRRVGAREQRAHRVERGLELGERQRGVALHELHRLREALPVHGGAQDVVAVDDLLQRGEEGVQAGAAVEGDDRAQQVGVALGLQQVVEEDAFLQRGERVEVLHVRDAAGHGRRRPCRSRPG
jgi:hypothetical protein